MRKFYLSLQSKFLLSIVLIIFPVIGVIFAWVGIHNENQAMDQVVDQARILARQVILTRQWVSDCGGVMVLQDSRGAKDTFYFYDDQLDTSTGIYKRFTPSMVTKKLSEYSVRQDLYRFRLCSMIPLNPDNRPDQYEKDALNKFMKEGLKEIIRVDQNDGKPYLQYMVPLYQQSSCLQCHKHQGDTQNDIGGGLSVILPVARIVSEINKDRVKLVVSGTGLILLTIFTLFVLMRHVVIKPLKSLGVMTDEITRGNLDARVKIDTGDEFENLGEAFNTMAQRISESHDSLEEKIAQDTRELSEANRELKTLDQLKSDFLANMSHELRSPLTVIRGGVDYLNRTIKTADNRNYIDIIDKNLNRLIRLVSDLFDFTKFEAKKIEWSFEQENLTVLIQEVIEIISPLAANKKISIVFEKQNDILVEFDLERIEQVLVNLIDNAIKFSDPESVTRIQTREEQQFVTVSVKDHGIGIPGEHLKTIFDKFSTLPTSRGAKAEGTGLGLAICKAIIEAHGGRIWAESVAGESATFYFTIQKNRQ